MMMADDGQARRIVRMRMEVEERDGYACALVAPMDQDAPPVEVLRMRMECGAGEQGQEVREAFMRLAARIATDMGTAQGEAPPQAEPQTPPLSMTGDPLEKCGEFQIAVMEGDGYVFAYLAEFEGLEAAPEAPFARLVMIAKPFMDDERVQEQFRKLLEVVGSTLAQSMADEYRQQHTH